MSVRIHGVPFSTEEQLDCFTLALESLLRFYGLELVHLHFDEWFFSCQRDADQVRLMAQTRDFPVSLARFGVELCRRQEADFAGGWGEVRAELRQGRPALALLDTYYLRPYYYPGRPIHQPHALIPTGYGPEGVWLVDPSPYTAFAGSIPLEGFARAWGMEEFFEWWQLRVPTGVALPAPEVLLEGLWQNLDRMLGSGEEGQGVEGIRRLAGMIEEAGEWTQERISPWLGQCAQFKWVGLARRKHAEFLAHAGERLGRGCLGQVGAELKGVAQEWMVGRNLALKGSRKQGREMAGRLARRLCAIADREEQLLLRLAGVLEEWT